MKLFLVCAIMMLIISTVFAGNLQAAIEPQEDGNQEEKVGLPL